MLPRYGALIILNRNIMKEEYIITASPVGIWFWLMINSSFWQSYVKANQLRTLQFCEKSFMSVILILYLRVDVMVYMPEMCISSWCILVKSGVWYYI